MSSGKNILYSTIEPFYHPIGLRESRTNKPVLNVVFFANFIK